jgi:hypothetical protein
MDRPDTSSAAIAARASLTDQRRRCRYEVEWVVFGIDALLMK